MYSKTNVADILPKYLIYTNLAINHTIPVPVGLQSCKVNTVMMEHGSLKLGFKSQMGVSKALSIDSLGTSPLTSLGEQLGQCFAP